MTLEQREQVLAIIERNRPAGCLIVGADVQPPTGYVEGHFGQQSVSSGITLVDTLGVLAVPAGPPVRDPVPVQLSRAAQLRVLLDPERRGFLGTVVDRTRSTCSPLRAAGPARGTPPRGITLPFTGS
jgi:hypothetical protein